MQTSAEAYESQSPFSGDISAHWPRRAAFFASVGCAYFRTPCEPSPRSTQPHLDDQIQQNEVRSRREPLRPIRPTEQRRNKRERDNEKAGHQGVPPTVAFGIEEPPRLAAPGCHGVERYAVHRRPWVIFRDTARLEAHLSRRRRAWPAGASFRGTRVILARGLTGETGFPPC